MSNDYVNMNIEQLESEQQRLMGQRAQIRESMKACAMVLSEKVTKERMREDIEAIGRKYNQVINPESIISAEAVNGQ